MKIESSPPRAAVAMPITFRQGRDASMDATSTCIPSSKQIRPCPLQTYFGTLTHSSLLSDDVASMLQLSIHQAVLSLDKEREATFDALRHSPWLSIADADSGDAQAQNVMQQAREILAGLLSVDEIESAEQRAGGSHSDFFKEIADLIGRLDSEWISKYSSLLAGYVGFYKELTDILADLKANLGTPDKDGNVNVNFTALRLKLTNLKAAWANKGFGEVFGTEAAAKQFLAELGIDGLTVVEVKPGGGWQISIDTGLIDSLTHVFPSDVGPISASALNEMMAQKEVMMERFNFINRALPEKYQRQLQMWDSLVKILSSTITAVTDADQAFIRAMAG
ncbi:IpaD/SipD/SspD family type III secretion system needle tip protein [Stenotrophomonas sp. WHRI 8082]|uniref:IpaD/SipD/SspD family type III secretion system needle tip protein n=1 Tax=Stenotrophomonas sp. WHRI 8082 TaxID=3162571 RepID=UPI0032ED2CE6